MMDRTEIEYQIGEIDRVMPEWVKSEQIQKRNVETCKDELKKAKEELAKYTTLWAEDRSYIAQLNDLREQYEKALEMMLDEPEAVEVLKHNRHCLDREVNMYTIEDIGQFNLMVKAFYTIGANGVLFDRTTHQIWLEGKVPESYTEFVYGVDKEPESTAPPPTPKTRRKGSKNAINSQA